MIAEHYAGRNQNVRADQHLQSQQHVLPQLVQNTVDRIGWENAGRGLGHTIAVGANRTCFLGHGSEDHEWKINLIAYLGRSVDKHIEEWMEWAQAQKENITGDVLKLDFEERRIH